MRDFEESFNEVKFAVEANSFEKHCLWEKYKDQIKWEQGNSGIAKIIGNIDNMPVVMSILIDHLNGVPVMFYEMTSLVVDYRIVDTFLEDKFGEFNKINKCFDANNFNRIIQELGE